VIPILKRQLKSFFFDLELDKDLDWGTINDLEKSAVIKKDVKLLEGLKLPRLLGPLEIWNSSPFGLDMQKRIVETWHHHLQHLHLHLRLRGL
jgi:hypothetical protein